MSESRWGKGYWKSPIGFFVLDESSGEFSLNDGDGHIVCTLQAKDREAAIVEAESVITALCQKTLAELSAPDLLQMLDAMVRTIEAHEIESLDCDRRGDIYCNCLSQQVEKAKAVIAKAKT